MYLHRHLLRTKSTTVVRHFCSTSSKHEFNAPTSYINSWKPSTNPKDAAAHLSFLRRDYERKVKQVRKSYIQEMELQRIEKLRKDEARKEALMIANQERRAAKEAKKKAEAIQRQAQQQEFRQMLMKERAEKLEYWRLREKKFEETKKEKKELLCRQSSLWVDESELEKRILEALVDTTHL